MVLCTTAFSRGAPGRVSRALWISTEAPGSPPASLLLHRGKAFSNRRHCKCLSVQLTNSFPCCPFEKCCLRKINTVEFHHMCFISLQLVSVSTKYTRTEAVTEVEWFKNQPYCSELSHTSTSYWRLRLMECVFDFIFFSHRIAVSASLSQRCLFDRPVINHHWHCLNCFECPGLVQQGDNSLSKLLQT